MDLPDSALLAAGATVALAGVARATKAVDTPGAVVGTVVGVACALGFGVAGLATLAAFFVLGSVATRVGWARKQRAGTAERNDGTRGARRVIGKGGVAALAGAIAIPDIVDERLLAIGFAGALAAALADTLATEIGTLSTRPPRLLPTLRVVPTGTPGAVSPLGLLGSVLGGAVVGATAWGLDLITLVAVGTVTIAAAVATLLESALTTHASAFRRRPGWVRNLLTTGAGAGAAMGLELAR